MAVFKQVEISVKSKETSKGVLEMHKTEWAGRRKGWKVVGHEKVSLM